MSETVLAVIITGAFNLLAVVIRGLISHREHKATAEDVRNIKDHILNGK